MAMTRMVSIQTTILHSIKIQFNNIIRSIYEKFNENSEQTYILSLHGKISGVEKRYPVSSNASGPTLQADFPEVEIATRLDDRGKFLVNYDDKKMYVDKGVMAGFKVLGELGVWETVGPAWTGGLGGEEVYPGGLSGRGG